MVIIHLLFVNFQVYFIFIFDFFEKTFEKIRKLAHSFTKIYRKCQHGLKNQSHHISYSVDKSVNVPDNKAAEAEIKDSKPQQLSKQSVQSYRAVIKNEEKEERAYRGNRKKSYILYNDSPAAEKQTPCAPNQIIKQTKSKTETARIHKKPRLPADFKAIHIT